MIREGVDNSTVQYNKTMENILFHLRKCHNDFTLLFYDFAVPLDLRLIRFIFNKKIAL